MYIVKYSELFPMAEMHSQARAFGHMHSFRIFYDIHSITYMCNYCELSRLMHDVGGQIAIYYMQSHEIQENIDDI